MKSSTKPRTPKGMRDFSTAEMSRRNYITDTIKSVFRKYNYSQIETPAMELLSVLTGKYGAEGDKLLFKVLNSGNFLNQVKEEQFTHYTNLLPAIAEKGLKYDLTVPFARYVTMNRHELSFPFKRFQIQPVWRADRPQRGRYREFYQCDADVVGSDSLIQDAEIVLMIAEVYKKLDLRDYVIKLNNRKILTGISEVIGMPGKEEDFCVAVDKLDKQGAKKVFEELSAKGCPETAFPDLEKMFVLPAAGQLNFLEEFLSESETGKKGLAEIHEVYEYLGANAPQTLEFDLTLARGLAYYTGSIFEVKPLNSAIGSINGGGRYDDLTGIFGMEGTSGIGISFGIDRIYDVLEEKQLFPPAVNNDNQVIILAMDKAARLHGLLLATELRKKEINCYVYPDDTKLKKQFAYANKNGYAYVIVIGAEEMEKQLYNLKEMSTGNQQLLTAEEIVNIIS